MPTRGSTGSRPLAVETLVPAGTTQADATYIRKHWSPGLILAVGDDVSGLRLPDAAKGARQYYIKNTGATQLAVLWVYPPVGGQINTLGTNAFITLAPGAATTFISAGSGQWYTIPLLPS